MRSRASLAALRVAALSVIAACSRRAPARPIDPPRDFVLIAYNDTARERFTRWPDSLRGRIDRERATIEYSAELQRDGSVRGVRLLMFAKGATSDSQRVYVPMPNGTMPMLGGTIGFLEALLRRARIAGGDTVSVPVLQVGPRPDREVVTVVRASADSVVLLDSSASEAMSVRIAVDSTGRITAGTLGQYVKFFEVKP